NNIQTFVHCNGDATIDMYIAAVENAKKVLHTTSIDRRPVVIHSQFVRPDQLDKYKELGMTPSFFTNHTFFWGDVHIKNLGQNRGYFESPLKTAEEKGIVFANHTDYGVTPLSQLFLLWTSVMRESRSGKVIGPEQRLTPMEGLRALTINGAYLYFEEKTKGSIEKGKLADFAILSDDPLTIDPEKIKDITVLETIKEGRTIYKKEAPTADKIYINGHILTMDAAGTEKEAVAIADGKILATGDTKEMENLKGPSTTIVDLGGKTLLPGFVDGHSHFMALELAGAVNIFSPPVGPVKNIPGIIRQLQDFVKTHPLKKGEWLTAFGYDIDQMEEKRHPAKEDLDKAFPDIPVMLIHASGHMCVVNSAALKVSGVTAATPDPPGGQVVRKPGSQEPTGLLLENGRTVLKFGSSKPSLEQQFATLQKQQEYYASMGITTAQDGYSSLDGIRLLKAAAEHHLLKMDIEALPGYFILDSLKGDPALTFNILHDHFKLAGFKMVADGSPQEKTAFMSQPYLTPAPGCTDHCTGIPTVTQAQLDAAVQRGFREHIHPFVHCNGDGAIDMYIHAVRAADSLLSTTSTDKRPVIIHSQFVRADQLDQYKRLGMLPSFFTNHAFFWGDTHEQNLGIPRAAFLSPLHTALGKGILFTNHTDFPVTPVNQIFLLWTSVVRQSRSGKTIGPDERLTPMQGLRAITINGAYEYFEEDIKGSLEKGKLADMVILSGNPLTVAPEKIKDIQVLETIKEGNTIFKRS
ncbi:MAG TPA: amidohydrolase family protein, partial [Puia sp.]|nr:amidohydrolase family protein [Puia sp.]